MKRSLRFLLIVAPMIVLLLGVPTGVALARRSPPSAPVTVGRGVIATAIANGTAYPGGNGSFIGPPLPGSQVSHAQTGIAGAITRPGPARIIVYTKAKRVAIVEIDPTTMIRFRGKNIKASEMMRGDLVTILGHRDGEGAFHADLIRVVRPPPPDPAPGAPR